ncbi:Luc7-related [Carpediemonas membranifera]|uniref:Luc7-related n=1 Tax=Carpediemonas membranifera TaxID=201153 RepID=A0A8J6BAE8_9EUKA|nr:Luc7-related [Carpediemonas membranifera]|eukprot:KAG9396092.1 Luc7-related [Carpediemonas membranifera]
MKMRLEEMFESHLGQDERNLPTDWRDHRVCKNYLCGLCPNEQLRNTRMDIGDCGKVHSDRLRAQFEAVSDDNPDKRHTQGSFMYHLYCLRRKCDDRINKQLSDRVEKALKVEFKAADVAKLEEADRAITEARQVLEAARRQELPEADIEARRLDHEQAQKSRQAIENDAITNVQAELNDEGVIYDRDLAHKIRVCSTCSAMMSVADTQRRLADHYAGRMHRCFEEIRRRLVGYEPRYAERGYGDGYRECVEFWGMA